MRDTSFTREHDDNEFSLDEGEGEGDTTDNLRNNARQSVNIAGKAKKRNAPPVQTAEPAKKSRVVLSNATKSKPDGGNVAERAINFLNPNKWSKEVRPLHLHDDDIFNGSGYSPTVLKTTFR